MPDERALPEPPPSRHREAEARGSAGEPSPLPWPRWTATAVVALFLGLAGEHAAVKSPTFDEPALTAAGYGLLRGLPDLNPENPPLGKLLLALPLLPLAPDPAPLADAAGRPWSWREAQRAAWQLWFAAGEPTAVAVAGPRLVSILLAVVCGIALYRRAAADGGSGWAGVAAVALFLPWPEVVAHGSLATLDLPVTAMIFLAWAAAAAAADRLPRRRGWAGLAAAGILAGAAVLVKGTGLAAPPLAALAVLSRPKAAPGRRVAAAALVVAAAVAAVLTFYALVPVRHPMGLEPAPDALGAVLPEPFAWSLAWQLRHAGSGHYRAYLDGRLSARGFPDYHLRAFLYKTPLPALALLVLAAVLLVRAGGPRRLVLAPLVAAALLAAPVVSGHIQIGLRYLLPAYPFLGLAVGVSLGRASAARGRRGRVAIGAAVATLLVLHATASLRGAPDHLASFNHLAGGRDRGLWRLADSNVDWGQDLTTLRTWLGERGDPPIRLSYFGTADPAAYGIRYLPLPSPDFTAWFRRDAASREIAPCGPAPGLHAVSVTNLHGVYLDDPGCFAWLRGRAPQAVIGGSILLYAVE